MKSVLITQGQCSVKKQASQGLYLYGLYLETGVTLILSGGEPKRKLAKCMWFLPFGLRRAEGDGEISLLHVMKGWGKRSRFLPTSLPAW